MKKLFIIIVVALLSVNINAQSFSSFFGSEWEVEAVKNARGMEAYNITYEVKAEDGTKVKFMLRPQYNDGQIRTSRSLSNKKYINLDMRVGNSHATTMGFRRDFGIYVSGNRYAAFQTVMLRNKTTLICSIEGIKFKLPRKNFKEALDKYNNLISKR